MMTLKDENFAFRKSASQRVSCFDGVIVTKRQFLVNWQLLKIELGRTKHCGEQKVTS